MRPNKPRIAYLDIETAPNIVASWTLWPRGPLSHDNIIRERHIICAAWKFHGEKKVHSVRIRVEDLKAKYPDFRVVEALHDLLSNVDAVIAHNGDEFDLKWIFARMVIQGFTPPPPFISIDTYKIAKSRGYFNCARLEYLAKVLGVRVGKIKTSFGMWLAVLNGDEGALRDMVRYNERDVDVLEGVYMKLRPYVPAKLNLALFADDPERTCSKCGAEGALVRRGVHRTKVAEHPRYQCRVCRGWSHRPESSKIVRS